MRRKNVKRQKLSPLARNRLLKVADVLEGIDRSDVKLGLRFAKQGLKEYARELVDRGDPGESYPVLRQQAISKGEIWLGTLDVDGILADSTFEEVGKRIQHALETSNAFRRDDEREQIGMYVYHVLVSIIMEDSGFEESSDAPEIEILRRPWLETFGPEVFLTSI